MSDALSALERMLHQTAARHRVLASNIANVDTPNYRAKDVAFDKVLGAEMRMAATNAKHLQAGPASGGSGETTSADSQPWADQNNVEMDLEVAKMTQNAMLFEAGVALLKKKFQMFKSALKTT